MRYMKIMMMVVFTSLLFPCFSFAQGPNEYIENTDSEGNTVILKRDYDAEKKVTGAALSGSCLVYHSSTKGSYLRPSTFIVAHSYSTNCSGYHSVRGVTKYPALASINIVLEKRLNGTWTRVASGPSGYSYSGSTGQYRIVVFNSGSTTARSWGFDYNLPL